MMRSRVTVTLMATAVVGMLAGPAKADLIDIARGLQSAGFWVSGEKYLFSDGGRIGALRQFQGESTLTPLGDLALQGLIRSGVEWNMFLFPEVSFVFDTGRDAQGQPSPLYFALTRNTLGIGSYLADGVAYVDGEMRVNLLGFYEITCDVITEGEWVRTDGDGSEETGDLNHDLDDVDLQGNIVLDLITGLIGGVTGFGQSQAPSLTAVSGIKMESDFQRAQAVPEPATVMLLVAGAVMAWRRRR